MVGAAELMAFVRGQGLSLVLQPQVELRAGRVVSAEALARWHHPLLGEISPAVFIPAVNLLGLDELLFEQVCRLAISAACAARRQGVHLPIAVNAPASTLVRWSSVNNLITRCKQEDLPPNLLKVELTEEVRPECLPTLANSLRRLARAGFEVCLDDFGTCYASMQLLCELPVSELKIDKYFIHNMMRDIAGREVVNMLIRLGQRLGLRVIAEGIETADEIPALLSLGCTHGQGYALGRPMSPGHLIGQLRSLNQISWACISGPSHS